MAWQLIPIVCAGTALAWPYFRRLHGEMRAHVAADAQERRAADLMEAIAADDAEGVAQTLARDATLPTGALENATDRAHPEVIRALLVHVDPCAPMKVGGLSMVASLSAILHAGGRPDHGVAALRVVLADPRVSAEAVRDALVLWAVLFSPHAPGVADRLAALFDHPSLSARALADTPERLAELERMERHLLAGRPMELGPSVPRGMVLQVNRRAAQARALLREHRAKIVPFPQRRTGRRA